MRIFQAVRAFFRILFKGEEAQREKPPELPPKPVEPEKPKAPAELPSLQVLMLLQREGRLLDFLKEDIDGLDDDQIGAAVRAIHKGCRKVLFEHVKLAPVRAESEGSIIEVPVGFDPSAIRLIGNVRGEPPFKGALKHHGWKIAELNLPALPAGQDPKVVAPAEVEIR
jgi:hypothetical protein